MGTWRPVTVATSRTPIVDWNPERTSWTLVNNGSVVLTISQDESNIAADGIPIEAGAGASMDFEGGDDPRIALYGVAASGTTNVRVQESFGRETP
jgi:hypothetical protein